MQVRFYATFRPIVGGKHAEVALAPDSTVRELVETAFTTQFQASYEVREYRGMYLDMPESPETFDVVKRWLLPRRLGTNR